MVNRFTGAEDRINTVDLPSTLRPALNSVIMRGAGEGGTTVKTKNALQKKYTLFQALWSTVSNQ